MSPLFAWCLLAASTTLVRADPDFYSAWCPCQPQYRCPNYYGRFFDDILIFGQVPPCKQFDHVRCCSADNIPEGFDLERQVQYFPEKVESQAQVVQQAIAVREGRNQLPLRSSASAPRGAVLRELAVQQASQRQDVQDFKLLQEKLKRDIANGIANPNPPCGCYSANTCPGRYATGSTGRDIGCLPGYETCCFLDDPWPNYQVTNLTINVPCAIADACARFYGTSPYDISAFGALEPCYLGQNRCLDYIVDESSPQPSVVRPAPTTTTTRRPTTRRPQTLRTTTYRPPTTTYRPYTRPTTRPTYRPTTRPTYRPTTQPTYRPTTRPTYRPITRPTYRPTTTTYRTTTRSLPEPQPSGGSSNIIDIVTNGAYLPPSRDFGSANERNQLGDISLQLPF